MKVCTICHIEKGLDEFHLCKKGKQNRKSKCKECVKLETKEYYQKNIDYYKNYRENNKDSIRERQKTWVTSNETKEKDRQRNWKKQNQEKILKWKEMNSDKLKEYSRVYTKKRRQTDELFKLSSNLRNRLNIYLRSKKIKKNNSTFEIIGLHPEKLKDYLEKKFTEGMSWDKLGSEIHIDHIKPLSIAKTESEVYELCHYTNLQPLWAKDNWIKNNRII
jgi:hypothetical protein